MTRYIGFSTGSCYKFLGDAPEQAIQLIHELGCDTIEINWHHAKKKPLLGIAKILNECSFKKISLHLPVDIRYDLSIPITTLIDTHELLSPYPFNYILMHPDLVDDWRVFKHPGISFSIENMDDRKDSFKDLQSLLNFFKKHSHIQLVFDVNHWVINQNSPTSLATALYMIRQAKIKIAGIHLSGDNYHEPLYKSKNRFEIIGALSDSNLDDDASFIIESVCKDVKEMEKELKFIRENLI